MPKWPMQLGQEAWLAPTQALNPWRGTGVLWQGSLWSRIQAPHRTHPYSQLVCIERECRCSGSPLGPRRSKGEERGCGLCLQMEVQHQTAESFSLQSLCHAVLVHLVPFPPKRMYSFVPWGCCLKGVWSPAMQWCQCWASWVCGWWMLFFWSHQPVVHYQRGEDTLSWHSSLLFARIVSSFSVLSLMQDLQSACQFSPSSKHPMK